MVNKNILNAVIIILVVIGIILLAVFLPKGSLSIGAGSNSSSSANNPTNRTSESVSTAKTVVSDTKSSQVTERTSTGSESVDKKISQTNTQTTDGIVTEPYQKNYERYENCGYIPSGYHRYQSNLCDPTQDELPITMPDPNEGLDPLNADPLWLSIQHGSLPCGQSGKLNYCQ